MTPIGDNVRKNVCWNGSAATQHYHLANKKNNILVGLDAPRENPENASRLRDHNTHYDHMATGIRALAVPISPRTPKILKLIGLRQLISNADSNGAHCPSGCRKTAGRETLGQTIANRNMGTGHNQRLCHKSKTHPTRELNVRCPAAKKSAQPPTKRACHECCTNERKWRRHFFALDFSHLLWLGLSAK